MQKTIFVSLLLPCALLAQENTSFQERIDARDAAISGRLSFDFTTQYFFRGIVQENKGIIVQPSIDLSMKVLEGDDTLRKLNVVVGQWNSLHSDQTNSGGSGGVWYESRFYLGVESQLGERWHAGLRYNTYSFPNSGNTPIQEFALSVRFDDAGVFSESFSLQPTLTIAKEVSGQRDGGNDKGTYAELAIAPSWTIGTLGQSDLTLTIPGKVGTSLGGYYERPAGGGDDFFGYLQGGAVLSNQLDFLPAGLGPWNAHVGLHLLLLAGNTKSYNSGDNAEFIFEFGMSTEF